MRRRLAGWAVEFVRPEALVAASGSAALAADLYTVDMSIVTYLMLFRHAS